MECFQRSFSYLSFSLVNYKCEWASLKFHLKWQQTYSVLRHFTLLYSDRFCFIGARVFFLLILVNCCWFFFILYLNHSVLLSNGCSNWCHHLHWEIMCVCHTWLILMLMYSLALSLARSLARHVCLCEHVIHLVKLHNILQIQSNLFRKQANILYSGWWRNRKKERERKEPSGYTKIFLCLQIEVEESSIFSHFHRSIRAYILQSM